MSKIFNLLLVALAFLITHYNIHAGIITGGYKAGACKLSGVKKYSWTKTDKEFTNIAFSFVNKSKNRISINVKNNSIGNTSKSVSATMDPAQVFEYAFNAKEKTTLEILDPAKKNKKIKSLTFTPGKTIYVNWDGNKVYPQKGPLGGFTGATDACYSLENNVQTFDIETNPSLP